MLLILISFCCLRPFPILRYGLCAAATPACTPLCLACQARLVRWLLWKEHGKAATITAGCLALAGRIEQESKGPGGLLERRAVLANLLRQMLRLKGDDMSELASRTSARATTLSSEERCGEALVCAFNEVRTELVSTLFFLLGNQEDAQDAAQDAFLKCWRSRGQLASVRNLRAWIFRVALNAARDLQRSAWRRRARPLAETPLLNDPAQASPEECAIAKETLERLRQALDQLRPEEKAVFLLRQNASLTYEEIAELRHLPVGTVKTQMRTALQKLRHLLQEKQNP
jgi:RNA polymerase sigma-70 factor (ECF subfamily)